MTADRSRIIFGNLDSIDSDTRRRACRLGRGMDGAGVVATGTGATGMGLGSKSKATERLDLRWVGGTDNG